MERDRVLRWCRQQALFSPGDAVTASLSGGADSVAMLHLLLSLRHELGISVRAAHYNHCLRGAESDRDEAFCRRLCSSWGVELACGRGDVAAYAAENGLGTELAARTLRYAFLCSLGGKIATAHTADDNLETVLLHLIRGAALRGLCGIPPVREQIVRPILCLTRADVERYLAASGLAHVTDSTNLQDDCLRNRIRHHVVPLLTAENPALAAGTLEAAESLRRDETFLQAQADALLEQASAPGGYRVAPLADAPSALRLRALRRLMERAGCRSLSSAHLKAADALLYGGPSQSLQLPGLTLRRQYALLLCTAAPDRSFSPFLLPLPGRHHLPPDGALLCEGPFPYRGEAGLCLTLSAPPLVRPRMPGDRLRLDGGAKSLKALMINRKIPAAERSGVPVLELDGTVIAAVGIGADPRYRPAAGQPCYRIQIVTERQRGRCK